MPEPVVRAERLARTFRDFWGRPRVRAVRDVSFQAEPGTILGLLGPNGSGKTTLINCITGFIRTESGRVTFKGKDITGWKPHKIADLGIARTFQIMRPYHSLPAFKNLIIPLWSPRARKTGGWRGGGKHGDRDTVAVDILEEIGFERDSRVPYKMASTLPTGYQKRLELARCMALRPEIIFCDEVFSGLSMSEIAGMLTIIKKSDMAAPRIIQQRAKLRL